MALAEHYEFRVGRVLGRTFSILWHNIVPFGILSLLFSAPTTLYPLFVTDPVVLTATSTQIGLFVLDSLLQYVAMAALVYGTIQQLRGRESGVGDIVGRGVALIFPVLGVAIVETIGILLGTLLLVVPGLILIVMWWVAIPVAVIERPGVFASLGRSAELTKGHRWKLFALLLILIGASILSTLVIDSLVGADFSDSIYATGTGEGIALWLWTGFFYALIAVLGAVTYYELRTAKEGVDIEEIAAVFD